MVRSVKYDYKLGKPGQNSRPYLQKIQNTKTWVYGTINRIPASKVRSPEFKPQCHKKNCISYICKSSKKNLE
jgi:hypothetical protein